MSDIAIRVENLSKLYHIGKAQQRHDTLRDALVDGVRSSTRWLRRSNRKFEVENSQSENLWALKDVSFEVKRGEVLGIIGRNGAGKSTLLKILSRITEPTEGRVVGHGRVGSLLEVGTGFHQELTGRENIYLNGAILGMKRTEIDRKFDEIVAFSEVEKFLDTPVKRYSSGMYVRLAFAVAAHLEPEILIVDEVLAVGDAQFQNKCLGKMKDVAQQGRTVIFVSHNMGAVANLCGTAILLETGHKVFEDHVEHVIRHYLTANSDYSGNWKRQFPIPDKDGIYFEEICIYDAHDLVNGSVGSDKPFRVDMVVNITKDLPRAEIAIRFTNQEGIAVLTTGNHDYAKTYSIMKKGRRKYSVEIPGKLLTPGLYSIIIAALIPKIKLLDIVDGEIVISVEDIGSLPTMMQDARLGVIAPELPWMLVILFEYADRLSDVEQQIIRKDMVMVYPNNNALVQNAVHLLRKACFGVVRATSAEFRAYTDIFYPSYADRVDWKSGLQDSHFMLYAIARATRPYTIVEIGSARGKSTCTMALACRQNGRGIVYAIDPHIENSWTEIGVKGGSFEFLKKRLKKYNLERWCQVIRTTSQEAARTWSKPIDILFIDGDHSYQGVKHDFEAFRSWLAPQALVLFHDSTWEYARENEYYRKDMGVPHYMAELQRAGFHSATIAPPPGLTVLSPQPNGFNFLPNE